jgi:spore germination protein GerM
MGLPAPTTLPPVLAPLPLPRQGLVGWLGGLSPRDRIIYGALLGLLVAIIGIYAVAGAQLISSALGQDLPPSPPPAREATAAAPPSATRAPSATLAPSATARPTATDRPVPTNTNVPTTAPTIVVFLTPTDEPFIPFPEPPPPTVAPPPSDTPAPPSDTATADASPAPTGAATTEAATATTDASPAATEAPTLAPTEAPTLAPTEAPTLAPTEAPTNIPEPPPPTLAPPPPTEAPSPPPTQPSPQFRTVPATLYFADGASGALYVPVQRALRVDDGRIAEAVARALIAGPRSGSGLAPVVYGATRLLGTRIDGDMLLVDLDRSPGDDRAFYALALALTELPGVGRMQVLVRGVPAYPTGAVGPLTRPLLNPDNPNGHSTAYRSGTRFLPLFFRYGGYHVRVTRLVGRTDDVAAATVRELLAGPGVSYGGLLESAIPAGVELRDLALRGAEAAVDLSAPFAGAADRRAAVNQLVLALTELRGAAGERRVSSVAIKVEGRPLGEVWGEGFAGPLTRPAVNAE